MTINQEDNLEKGAFYIIENGVRAAEMTYVWAGANKIIIDHTEVGDSLRGTGVGKQLVQASVHFAREKGLKILPLCPFARSVFDKVVDFQDVLSK